MIPSFHLPEKQTAGWAKGSSFSEGAKVPSSSTSELQEDTAQQAILGQESISSRLYSASNLEGLFSDFLLIISGLI